MEQLSLELLDSRDLVAGQRTQCSSPFKHMGCFGILHRAAWVHCVLAMSPHTEVEGAGMVPLFLISVLTEQLSPSFDPKTTSLLPRSNCSRR